MAAGPFKSALSSTDHCSGVEEAVGVPIDKEIKRVVVEIKMGV